MLLLLADGLTAQPGLLAWLAAIGAAVTAAATAFLAWLGWRARRADRAKPVVYVLRPATSHFEFKIVNEGRRPVAVTHLRVYLDGDPDPFHDERVHNIVPGRESDKEVDVVLGELEDWSRRMELVQVQRKAQQRGTHLPCRCAASFRLRNGREVSHKPFTLGADSSHDRN